MRATTAIAILAASAATAQAQGLERGRLHDILTLNDGARITIPACRDAQGRKVRYVLAAGQGTMQADSGRWSIVSVFTPVSGPQVLIGPDLLGLPRQTVQFVVEHECHHHASGDVFRQFMEAVNPAGQPLPVHQMEYDADCTAAARVRDLYGYTADDLRVAFGVFPAHENSPTHPPTAARLKRAIDCLSRP
jgi:hypothetical protein